MNDTKATIPRPVAEAAADWVIRHDGGALSAQDARAFQAWYAQPAHRDAFDRLAALWGSLDAAPRPAGDVVALPPPRAPAPRRRSAIRVRRRSWAGGAIAASLALAVLGAVQDWPTRLRADYATGLGERRQVTLEDGSRVLLDGASAIALDYAPGRRSVRLLAGTALFEVAPDPARPFTVEAAGGSATALGTAFAVRTHDGLAELVVTQHRVKLAGGGRSEVVGEGQRADFGGEMLGAIAPAGEAATAWTRGRLVVVDRPLGEVVAEIARHRHGYLAVSGAAAATRVSGVYDLDHPLAAIDSIERSLGLAAFRLSDRIIILHR